MLAAFFDRPHRRQVDELQLPQHYLLYLHKLLYSMTHTRTVRCSFICRLRPLYTFSRSLAATTTNSKHHLGSTTRRRDHWNWRHIAHAPRNKHADVHHAERQIERKREKSAPYKSCPSSTSDQLGCLRSSAVVTNMSISSSSSHRFMGRYIVLDVMIQLPFTR